MYLVIFILMIILSVFAPGADYWFSEFQRLNTLYQEQWLLESAPCIRLPLRDGRVLLWRDAVQALPAYLDMYSWSGDLTYLDLFVTRADQIVNYAIDSNSDGYLGWPNIINDETITIDFGITATLMRFVNLVNGDSQYTQAVARYRAIAEPMALKWEHLWVQLEDGRGVYMVPPNGTIPPRSLPINMQAIAGSYHYEMMHEEKTTAIRHAIESQFQPHPTRVGAVIWPYVGTILPGDQPSRIDDINHAGPTISFLLRVRPDLRPALTSMALGVWEGRGLFNWKIDGTEDLPEDELPYDHYLPFYRHMELGPALHDAILAQWTILMDRDIIKCKPGSYMSIPALMLLHQFPSKQMYLPMVHK